MLSEQVLQQMKSALQETFGERFHGMVLYGSEVRGEARSDSDIDLLVLLRPPVNRAEDLQSCIRALYPLVLQLERPIHAKPVDLSQYEGQRLPLYREAKQEGVLV